MNREITEGKREPLATGFSAADPPQRHRIRQLDVEVNAPWESSTQQIRNRITQVLKPELLERLDKVISKLYSPDTLVKIEHLEIDLGDLSEEELEADFEAKIELELQAVLARIGGGEGAKGEGLGGPSGVGLRGPSGGDGGAVKVHVHTELDVVEFFLVNGGMPWWSGSVSSEQVAVSSSEGASVLGMVRRVMTGDAFLALLRRYRGHQVFLERLVRLLDAGDRLRLLELVGGAVGVKSEELKVKSDKGVLAGLVKALRGEGIGVKGEGLGARGLGFKELVGDPVRLVEWLRGAGLAPAERRRLLGTLTDRQLGDVMGVLAEGHLADLQALQADWLRIVGHLDLPADLRQRIGRTLQGWWVEHLLADGHWDVEVVVRTTLWRLAEEAKLDVRRLERDVEAALGRAGVVLQGVWPLRLRSFGGNRVSAAPVGFADAGAWLAALPQDAAGRMAVREYAGTASGRRVLERLSGRERDAVVRVLAPGLSGYLAGLRKDLGLLVGVEDRVWWGALLDVLLSGGSGQLAVLGGILGRWGVLEGIGELVALAEGREGELRLKGLLVGLLRGVEGHNFAGFRGLIGKPITQAGGLLFDGPAAPLDLLRTGSSRGLEGPKFRQRRAVDSPAAGRRGLALDDRGLALDVHGFAQLQSLFLSLKALQAQHFLFPFSEVELERAFWDAARGLWDAHSDVTDLQPLLSSLLWQLAERAGMAVTEMHRRLEEAVTLTATQVELSPDLFNLIAMGTAVGAGHALPLRRVSAQLLHDLLADKKPIHEVLAAIGQWSSDPRLPRLMAGLPSQHRIEFLNLLAPGYSAFLLALEQDLESILMSPSFWEITFDLILHTPAHRLHPSAFLDAVLGSQVVALREWYKTGEWKPKAGYWKAYFEPVAGVDAPDWQTQLPALIRALPELQGLDIPAFDYLQHPDEEKISDVAQLDVWISTASEQLDIDPWLLRDLLGNALVERGTGLRSPLPGLLIVSPWVAKPLVPDFTILPSAADLVHLLHSATLRPEESLGLVLALEHWIRQAGFAALLASLSIGARKQVLELMVPAHAVYLVRIVDDVELIDHQLGSVRFQSGSDVQVWEALFRHIRVARPGQNLQPSLMQGILKEWEASPEEIRQAVMALGARLQFGQQWLARVQAAEQERPINSPVDGSGSLGRYLLHGQLPVGSDAAQLRIRLRDLTSQFPSATAEFLQGLGEPAAVARSLRLLLPPGDFFGLLAVFGGFNVSLLQGISEEVDRFGSSGYPLLGAAFREALMAVAMGGAGSTVALLERAVVEAVVRLRVPLVRLIREVVAFAEEGSVASLGFLMEGLGEKLGIAGENRRVGHQGTGLESRHQDTKAPSWEGTAEDAEASGRIGSSGVYLEAEPFGKVEKPKVYLGARDPSAPLRSARDDDEADLFRRLKRKGPERDKLLNSLPAQVIRTLLDRHLPESITRLDDLVLLVLHIHTSAGKNLPSAALWQQLLELALLRKRGLSRVIDETLASTLTLGTPASILQKLHLLVGKLAPLFRHPGSFPILSNAIGRLKQQHPPERKAQTQEKRQPWDATTTPETPPEFAVSNAGVVLIWPFFSRYFDVLGLLKSGQFKNNAAQERATFLLHYLCTGVTAPPEEDLLFPKLLCGLPTDALLKVRSIRLKQQEKDMTQSLLKAAISHWKAIGETSPATFQESFLHRPGILRMSDEQWLLRVDRRSYDLLLRTLPWGLSPVNLPWMKKMLNVEWG